MTVPDDIAARILARNPNGEQWLAEVDAMIARLQRAWQLTMLVMMPAGLAGLVFSCEREGAHCMLKMDANADALDQEQRALRLWGAAEVRVPKIYATTRGAYLMERISPGSYWEGADEDVYGLLEVMRAHALPEIFDASAYPLAHQQLLTRLQRYRGLVTGEGSVAQRKDFDTVITELEALRPPSEESYLVHADLHGRAILTAKDGPALIDPMAAVGHWAYDAATFAGKRDPMRLAARVEAMARRWPDEASYIRALSKMIALEDLSVNWLYKLRDPESEEYSALLDWIRG